MARKSSLPNENAWMNITKGNIDDLGRLRYLTLNIFKDKKAINNFKKLARIPEGKLDALLKLVGTKVHDNGSISVGRFTSTPVIQRTVEPRGIRGEILSIIPGSITAGKTKTKKRKRKSKGTRRR